MDSIEILPQTVTGGTYSLEQEGTSSVQDSEGNFFPFRPVSADNKVMPGYPIKVKATAEEGYTFEGVEVNGKFYDDSLFVVSTTGATVKPIFKKEEAIRKIVLTVPSGQTQQYFLSADHDGTPITVDWGDGNPVTYTLSTNRSTIACEAGTSSTTVTITGDVTYADFSSYPGFGNDNGITAIDISGNDQLRTLITYMNEIGTLDVSNETRLETLDCSYSELEELDVTNNTKLVSLKAYGNYLEGIDISTLSNLKELDVKGNYLETISFANNPELSKVSIQNNYLSDVGVSNLTKLEYFYAQGNYISEIDLSSNSSLVDLNLSNNDLSAIDLSSNTALTSLNLSGNTLETLDLSKNKELNYINVSKNEWSACTLNDFYYNLPEYPSDAQVSDMDEKIRLRVVGNSTSSNDDNEATTAESVIATGKGWVIDEKGDGTGCDMAYVTILPIENGTASLKTNDGTAVNSGDKVLKNTVVYITTTPDNGYMVKSIKANGEEVSNNQFTVLAATDVLVQFTVYTGINGVTSQPVHVESGKGELLFDTEGKADIAIYTLSGKLVYKDFVEGQTAISLKAGVYVVKVGKETRNILVK